MHDIQRYEVNEQGDLPVSYGRYVRWEDVEDLLKEMQEEIDGLEDEVVKVGKEGLEEGVRIGLLRAIKITQAEIGK